MTRDDEIMKLRGEGLSFAAIAARLRLTKGQVSGVVFRATSDKYRGRETASQRLQRHARRFVERWGPDDATRAIAQAARAVQP